MRYCHECGSEIVEDAAFCRYCGIGQKPIQKKVKTVSDKTPDLNPLELGDLDEIEIETIPKDLSNIKSQFLHKPENNQDSSPNAVLEMNLKTQIELQRVIVVQNQKIIELLERLLKKFHKGNDFP